jgi:hypothetical protein
MKLILIRKSVFNFYAPHRSLGLNKIHSNISEINESRSAISLEQIKQKLGIH